MRLLLDTHAAIWLARGDAPSGMVAAFEDPTNEIVFSAASLWEMAIERSIGKLALGGDLAAFEARMRAEGVQIVPVSAAHALRVEHLPWVHRDPFDRLLAATCLVEGWRVMSADAVFDAYGVARVH